MAREMKDSGIEWIGPIPSTWSICKNKYLLEEMYSGGTPTASNEDFYAEEGTPFVSISDMSSTDYVADTKKKLTERGIRDKNLAILPVGTVLYSIYATIGAVSELSIPATISQAMLALRLKPSYDKQYYKYNLQAMRDYIFFNANGNTQFNLNAEKVWNFFFVVPPLSDQKRIVKCLDTECARIDAVIGQTRASIEEYKKLKHAVITQAVTKGIRPNRKMKNSGDKWLGDIPIEWSCKKFKYIATVKSSLVAPDEYGDYPQVSPDNIEKGSGRLLPCRTVAEVGVISWNHLFYKGQILYSKIRPKLNKVVIAPFDGLCSADMYPIETSLNDRFFLYSMQSDAFLANIGLITENRVKMPKINQEELGEIRFGIPSDTEQAEIVACLDNRTEEIDGIITNKEQLIMELESYKKSLIYEYVTGKKEVTLA